MDNRMKRYRALPLLARGRGGDEGRPGQAYRKIVLGVRGPTPTGGYVAYAHEDWGANQGYLESHGDLEAWGIGDTAADALRDLRSTATDMHMDAELLAEAYSAAMCDISLG